MDPARSSIVHLHKYVGRRRVNMYTTWKIMGTKCRTLRKGYCNKRVYTNPYQWKPLYTTHKVYQKPAVGTGHSGSIPGLPS